MSFFYYMKRVHWYACPSCGVEYRTQQRALDCRQKHAVTGDRPESVRHFIGVGRLPVAKIEILVAEDGSRYCGECGSKTKVTLFSVMVEEPGTCARCERPITAKVVPYNPPSPVMTLQERRHMMRLDTTPRYKKEKFRRELHAALSKHEAYSLIGDPRENLDPELLARGIEYEEGLKREFGHYRGDPTIGDMRLPTVGHISADPNAEPVEVTFRW